MKNTMVEKKVRKIFELAMAIVLMAAFASCGNDASQEDSQIESSSLQEAEAVESAEEAQSQTDSEESAESETETEESEAEELVRGIDLSNAEVTEVLKVAISGNFSQSTSLENLYNVNVYHTDLLGRFGCPIEIHSDNFEEAVIVFEYNPDELYALPCENLIILHYDEENDHYDIVESKLNEEEHTIGAQITETGVYMLTNGLPVV